jgi:hypothetical protein
MKHLPHRLDQRSTDLRALYIKKQESCGLG